MKSFKQVLQEAAQKLATYYDDLELLQKNVPVSEQKWQPGQGNPKSWQKKEVAKAKYAGKNWGLYRFTRDDGTDYWELLGDDVGNNPVLYSNGKVAFDKPGLIPMRVKAWVSKRMAAEKSGKAPVAESNSDAPAIAALRQGKLRDESGSEEDVDKETADKVLKAHDSMSHERNKKWLSNKLSSGRKGLEDLKKTIKN